METGKNKRKKVLTIVGTAVVLLVALGAGIGLRALQSRGNTPETPPSRTLPKTVDDAQNLRAQGKTDEADRQIDAALNDPKTSSEERYLLYMQKGNLHIDKGDYTAATDALAKATEIEQTSDAYVLMAEAYAAAGDKAKAIEAYKKAIPLIKQSPVSDDDKEAYETKIRVLGGQP